MLAQNEIPRPHAITVAVNFLWGSLAVSLVKMMMYLAEPVGGEVGLFTHLALVATFALIGFLISKIAAGRNWARILFFVLFASGIVPALPVILDEFAQSLVTGTLSLVQNGCQIYGLFLLFRSREAVWFCRGMACVGRPGWSFCCPSFIPANLLRGEAIQAMLFFSHRTR